jgi:cytochrome c peroxidase
MCILNRNRRRAFSVLIAVALNVTSYIPLSAQSGGSFQITNSVVAAGGGESKDATNNRYDHESTVGEHAAGTLLRNPPFSQTAGLWASHIGLTPTASAATISGRILTSEGTPLAGAAINLGGSRTLRAITDANGFYTFDEMEVGGFYTVTPSRVNYSFDPSNRSFSLVANITDAAFTATASGGTANALDTTEFFVRQHYVDFLLREPDSAGLNFWSNNIDSCGINATCRAEKRIDTSAAFFLSIEFQQTGFLVERVYQSAFNRFPSYRDFIRDTQEMGRDVIVGQGSWQAQLDANKQQFATDFVARPDFIAVYGGLSNQQYVDALNANTGGSLSATDRNALIAGLNGAMETRASVLRKVVENAAFTQHEFNRAFVLMQYFGYLRRNPNDAPDSDFAGYNFWLAKLNSFGGDFRKADMVKAFITSSEYRGRFGDEAVARGNAAFNNRNLSQFGGNGRSCADCHMPSDSFQLSPASARARFDALQAERVHNPNADDPLFRPVDADDFRINGANASDFSNLVENGLVRVTMPLPLNVKLLDPVTGQPTDETSVDLWRAVMPVINVAITGPDGVLPIWPPGAPRTPIMGQDPNGPNRQGGYQHDARFGTLQEQARGAFLAHAQVSTVPPVRMLDDLTAFQQTLFSSFGVERLADAIRSGSTPFPDPDPVLNELEQQGKVVFNRACAQCHGGTLHPSGSTPEATIVRPIARYHPIFAACPRPATDGFSPCPERLARNARTYRITLADGTTQTFTTSDPGRLLLTGQIADLGVMDVTQLRGISKTAPYFHNNSAATLEEVLDHYDALFRRAARLNPPPNLPPFLSSNGLVVDRGFVTTAERAALLAYLRKL